MINGTISTYDIIGISPFNYEHWLKKLDMWTERKDICVAAEHNGLEFISFVMVIRNERQRFEHVTCFDLFGRLFENLQST